MCVYVCVCMCVCVYALLCWNSFSYFYYVTLEVNISWYNMGVYCFYAFFMGEPCMCWLSSCFCWLNASPSGSSWPLRSIACWAAQRNRRARAVTCPRLGHWYYGQLGNGPNPVPRVNTKIIWMDAHPPKIWHSLAGSDPNPNALENP